MNISVLIEDLHKDLQSYSSMIEIKDGHIILMFTTVYDLNNYKNYGRYRDSDNVSFIVYETVVYDLIRDLIDLDVSFKIDYRSLGDRVLRPTYRIYFNSQEDLNYYKLCGQYDADGQFVQFLVG